MHFYQKSASKVLEDLNTSPKGLSSSQASKLAKLHGPNTIQVKTTPWWKKVLEPLIDVFTLVLAAAAAISFFQGERLDGFIILSIIAVSATIFYAQRLSTERVLRSLNKKNVDTVITLRNNQKRNLPVSALVPGDIVMLDGGEKVPADIRIIESDSLRVDESVLTGESEAVDKDNLAIRGDRPIYEQSNMLFSGSFVVGGTASGVVVATGNNSQFGSIATLAEQSDAKSPVQKKIDKLITRVVILVGAMAVATLGLSLLRGMEIGESLRFVIALSVSAIPEGLPIAVSVILVLGVRRMAAKKALVQQMRAVETLGVVTTIATDKTGTLTENRLTVQETWHPSDPSGLDLALVGSINYGGNLNDPLDRALVEHARKTKGYSDSHRPAQELPFSHEYSLSASIWHSGSDFTAYIKGAPEAVINRTKLSKSDSLKAQAALADLTEKGYRVIALASTVSKSPINQLDQLLKQSLKFEGFVAIADVLRPGAIKAIKTALAAGVSVRMITGDHAETAYQIGKNLGMVSTRGEVLDCRTLDKLSDDKLEAVIKKTKVFARVIPEQKHRILAMLKKRHITAMTGDGVNDVPALTNAHIGIAMGSGADIAKDAGDIILLDDNFKTIIDAMREGRIIISNVRRMLQYLLATNAGEVLAMLGALIIGTRLPLEPVQILWVNLVTDTSMVIPLGLEPAEKDVMRQKPKKPNAPILNRLIITRIILTAIVIAILTLATYLLFSASHGHAYAQTLAFASLVVVQWGNAFAARSHTETVWSRLSVLNRSFYVGLGISILLQLLVFFGPLGELLHIAKVDLWHLGIVSLISFIAPIVASDIHKKITRART